MNPLVLVRELFLSAHNNEGSGGRNGNRTLCHTEVMNTSSSYHHADYLFRHDPEYQQQMAALAGFGIHCVPALWVFTRCIWNALQIPAVFGAEYVGFTRFARYQKLKNIPGHWVYSYLFGMFGVMMTSGGIGNCLLFNSDTPAEYIVLLIDGTLTSSIAYTFGLTSLVDLGILQDESPQLKKLMGGGILALALGYVYSILNKAPLGFLVLYLGVIALCCGGYVVTQIYLLLKSGNKDNATWLMYAGASGGAGLYLLLVADNVMCEVFPYLNGEAIWYWLSVVSMYCISRYFEATHQPPPPPGTTTTTTTGAEFVPVPMVQVVAPSPPLKA